MKSKKKPKGFVYFDTSYIDKEKKYKRNRWRTKITINKVVYRHYVDSYEDGKLWLKEFLKNFESKDN